MLLQFVSEPTIGPKERRLIRSHVMKGKNAGKPRPARSRLIHRSIEAPKCTANDVSDECQLYAKHSLSLPRLFWNELSLASYPCHLGPETEKFVYQRLRTISKALYPPEFCSELNLSRYAWFQYVLEDAAYFHTLLALTSSFPDTNFGGPRQISPNSLHHISQAYRMTNTRLSGPEACSDKAIAVVTMLAIYQRMHHQQAVGLVHFEGLRRMINLRGGLKRFSRENRTVAQKPWRLALEFALQDGGAVGFGVDEVEGLGWGYEGLEVTGGNECNDLCRLDSTKGLDPVLLAHFASISCFTNYLNTNTVKVDALDYSDAICIRLHHLLAYTSLSPEHRSHLASLDSVVHLTLVAIMTTLMPEYGHNQARYELLASQMRVVLQTYATKGDRDCELLLWALFVGYATILNDGGDEAWLIALAADVCGRLDLHDWRTVRGVLRQYAWICAFYDNAGLNMLLKITKEQGRIVT